MPAKDIFHDTVKQALINDGWLITADPFHIKLADSDFNMYVDLAAEKVIVAEKANHKIAVEIKSFIGTSFINDFHEAVGQFLNYQVILQEQQPERHLYLAISIDIYRTYFQRHFVQLVCQKYQLALLVFDPKQEVIVLWKK